MNQYWKYILLIIFGIILFTLLNNRENFSIGNQLFIVDNEKIKEEVSMFDEKGDLISCKTESPCTLDTFITIFYSISDDSPTKTLLDIMKYLEKYDGMSNFIESKFLKAGLRELNLVDNDESKINTIALFKADITIYIDGKELKTFRDGIEYMFENILEDGTALIVGLIFLDKVEVAAGRGGSEGGHGHAVIFYKESDKSYWYIDRTNHHQNFNVTNVNNFLTEIYKVYRDYYFIKLDYKSAELTIKDKSVIKNNPINIERLPEDTYWEELSLKERMAANTLGLGSEQKWERHNENEHSQNWHPKSWDQLDLQEKNAANIIKYNKYNFIRNPTTSSEEEREEEGEEEREEGEGEREGGEGEVGLCENCEAHECDKEGDGVKCDKDPTSEWMPNRCQPMGEGGKCNEACKKASDCHESLTCIEGRCNYDPPVID